MVSSYYNLPSYEDSTKHPKKGLAGASSSLLLDGHSINILASNLFLGYSTAASSVSGSVSFDTGTFDVSVINNMAYCTNGSASGNFTLGFTPSTGWRNGDFNYDGNDYTLIDNAFNSQGTTSYAAVPASPAEMAASDTEQPSIIPVPEPASFAFALIGATSLLVRHRRN